MFSESGANDPGMQRNVQKCKMSREKHIAPPHIVIVLVSMLGSTSGCTLLLTLDYYN